MRTRSSFRPQSSCSGAGKSRYWVRKTPAEPGAPTTTSCLRAIAWNHTGAIKTAHTDLFWAAGSVVMAPEDGVPYGVPGELDHATGPEEATVQNPKGPTGPRPDSMKVECQYCGCWKGLRKVATLLRCGSRPLGFLLFFKCRFAGSRTLVGGDASSTCRFVGSGMLAGSDASVRGGRNLIPVQNTPPGTVDPRGCG